MYLLRMIFSLCQCTVLYITFKNLAFRYAFRYISFFPFMNLVMYPYPFVFPIIFRLEILSFYPPDEALPLSTRKCLRLRFNQHWRLVHSETRSPYPHLHLSAFLLPSWFWRPVLFARCVSLLLCFSFCSFGLQWVNELASFFIWFRFQKWEIGTNHTPCFHTNFTDSSVCHTR